MTEPSESDRPDVLIAADQIARRVAEMGHAIGRDLPAGVHCIAVMKGAFMFLSDLVRAIDAPVSIDFVALSSYGDRATSSGLPRLIKDLDRPIDGRDILVVEDIVDSGATLAALQAYLQARGPRTMRTACLLDKPARRRVNVRVDYVGFSIEDQFVVGYGLDHADRYRNLPHIAVLKSL